MLSTCDVRREEKMKPSLCKCLICIPGALAVLQQLPVALPAQASFEKTERKKNGKIKHRNIARCCSPWLFQPLWCRKHFNSPLSSICACGGSHGCRRPLFITADRSQIRWFVEQGRGWVGVYIVWGRVSDGAGQTVGAAAVHFPPQQLTVSPWPLWVAWFPPAIVHMLGNELNDNWSSGTSPPTAARVGLKQDMLLNI